jgi:hypothetical protein
MDLSDRCGPMNLYREAFNGFPENGQVQILRSDDDVTLFLLRDDLELEEMAQTVDIKAWIYLQKQRNAGR